MILIPEIETVVILVPRTGSGSLRRAIAQKYPRSMLIYRHMEADGVPHGYDRWPKVGVVRHPRDRMWSLYNFMNGMKGNHDQAYINAMHESTLMPFDLWVRENKIVFTSPYDSANMGRFWPGHTVRHPLPENRKSQFVYLRPDLGTRVYGFGEIHTLANRLGVMISHLKENATEELEQPRLSTETLAYMHKVFRWDFEQYR